MFIVNNSWTKNRSRMFSLFIGMSVVSSMILLSGCYSEGGIGMSADMFTYVSREHQAWTITVLDTRTREPVWTIDVPVGQQLVIHFVPGDSSQDSYNPDVMKWALMKAGTDFGPLSNRIAVPSKDARRVDTYIRSEPDIAKASGPSPFKPPVTQVADPITPPGSSHEP